MYKAEAKRLDEKIRKKVESANWNNIPLMLIGFDVYVDVDGNVGFYEGNSCPFALGDYRGMFGKDLSNAIAAGLKPRGIVGINIDLNTETGSARSYNAGVARQICNENGIEVVMGAQEKMRWDKEKGKFYFQDGKRKDFDFLFNRCPSSWTSTSQLVPQSSWFEAPVMSPIVHSLILGNKARTGRAFREAELNTPIYFRAENKHELAEAAEKIMAHIGKRHPNYEAPYILTKPVCGTGANGIRVFKDAKTIDFKKVRYPCLVQERISVSPNNGHMIDMRVFYCNRFASHCVGRTAPGSLKDNSGSSFDTSAIITNLCQGGSATRVDPELEKIVGEYVLAGALAIHNRAVAYWEEKCTAQK